MLLCDAVISFPKLYSMSTESKIRRNKERVLLAFFNRKNIQ